MENTKTCIHKKCIESGQENCLEYKNTKVNREPQKLVERSVVLGEYGLHSQFNFLLGRLKTIVDACISEPAQNKALKDLIAQDVWHTYNHMLELSGIVKRVINDGVTDIA